MNRYFGPALVIGALVAFFIVKSFLFTVHERRQAIVLRFGDPVRVEATAGLKFKLPIENVIYLDKRNLEYDNPALEIFTVNQERLVVDAFARYRIIEPLRYYESFRQGGASEQVLRREGERRLAAVLESSLRRVLGEATDTEIIRNERTHLMQLIRDSTAKEARKFGVRIIDTKIRRADFPQENEEDVYQRMRSERIQIAQRIRAEGEEQFRRITAQADRAETEILARANRMALEIQGKADATRNCIFAGAYDGAPVRIEEREPGSAVVGADIVEGAPEAAANEETASGVAPATTDVSVLRPDNALTITCKFVAGGARDPQRAEFFAFYRSLQAYEAALKKGETTILLSPDSEFMRYFSNLDGRRQ